MPHLLVYKEKCRANLERMAAKALRHDLELRPHFKTHQNPEVGSWYRDFGVKAITVSSFHMAESFARSGWEDILVAFPFVPTDLERLDRLASNLRMAVLIDHPRQLEALGGSKHPADFYLDIDTGYGRTGIPAREREVIADLVKESGRYSRLRFRGFYCHAGHSYKAPGRTEREAIHKKAMEELAALKKEFSRHDPLVLYGDTPNCSTMEDFGPADVLTPGNFIYYDLFQTSIGSCRPEDIAVQMECPVSGIYPERNQAVIHGGAVHFSKEGLVLKGRTLYGHLTEDEQVYLLSLSQEHGILQAGQDFLGKIRPGDLLRLLPVHSCLTANLMKDFTRIITG